MKRLLGQLTALAAFTMQCHPATLSVSADANIFGAGHTTAPHPGGGGAGTLPPSYSFPPGPGKVLRFASLAGRCTLTTGLGFHGPEGYPLPTDINSTGGISGLRHDREGFLVGVFLGADEPASPAPPKLDFRASALGSSFAALSPQIGRTFCIPGPRASTGVLASREFHVAPTATRLFLGFADAYTYTGDPGQYHDNAGALTATFEMLGASPSAGGVTVATFGKATGPGPELHAFPAIELRWNSEPNTSYQIRWTPSLAQPQWTNLGPRIVPTAIKASAFDSAGEHPQGFYRVQVVPSPQREPQMVRLSVGDTVVVRLDGTPVPVARFTNQVASDGTVTIWNSMHFRAAGLTTDELASQIRWTLVTNWVHVDGVSVLKVRQTGCTEPRDSVSVSSPE